MKRKGNCWVTAFNGLITPPLGPIAGDVELVHGMPTGTRGEAAKVGVYCHAWLEYPAMELVYDTEQGCLVPKDAYYLVGKIEYAMHYTRNDALKMVHEHGTYGPWDEKLLMRDIEISERGVPPKG